MKYEIFWLIFGSILFWSVFLDSDFKTFKQTPIDDKDFESNNYIRRTIFFATKELSRQLHGFLLNN
jgi:hypothetical protein